MGGAEGMLRGFASIFGDANTVHIVVSEEAATYRPEMQWVAHQLENTKVKIQNPNFDNFAEGDAVYRFFELFDLQNVPNSKRIFEIAAEKKIRLNAAPQTDFRRENALCPAVE